jgi:spore coat polysaccharide biosynthesis protein SpsF
LVLIRPVKGIIQARIGSSRLPEKMLTKLHGFPVIEWVWRRAKKSQLLDEIIVAIPESEENDSLYSFLNILGAEIYRGSEKDVLDRFTQTAHYYSANTIVRICADNPFISGSEIDNLIMFFEKHDLDYAYNHIPKNNCYPDGLGAEIVTMKVLEQLTEIAYGDDQREHIFNYIWENKNKYKIDTFDPLLKELCYPEIKLDLDTSDDLKFLQSLNVKIDMTASEIIAEVLRKRLSLI